MGSKVTAQSQQLSPSRVMVVEPTTSNVDPTFGIEFDGKKQMVSTCLNHINPY